MYSFKDYFGAACNILIYVAKKNKISFDKNDFVCKCMIILLSFCGYETQLISKSFRATKLVDAFKAVILSMQVETHWHIMGATQAYISKIKTFKCFVK